MSKGAKRAVSLLERSPAQNLLLALKEKAMRQGVLFECCRRKWYIWIASSLGKISCCSLLSPGASLPFAVQQAKQLNYLAEGQIPL